MTTREKIAARIKEMRQRSGLSQSELARQVGVERQQVASWENARNKPNEDSLLLVAKALQTSISFIFGETDDPRPAPNWTSGVGPGNASEAVNEEVTELLSVAMAKLKRQMGLKDS